MSGLEITVEVHDIPDVPLGLGWIGSEMTVICGPVIGEVVRTIMSTGDVSREAIIDIDGHGGAGVARIVADDPQLLRRVAAVATVLADHLDG